jgi:hypothetical protein
MTHQERERRSEERFPLRLVVDVGGTLGATTDISVSGVFFEIPVEASVGDPIDLKIYVEGSDDSLVQKCQGNIVRVERREGKTGVAVKITDSVLERAQIV